MKKKAILVIFLICLPLYSALAFQFLFKDNKGHYHYRCVDASYIDYLEIVFRENGILIKSKKRGLVLKRNKYAKHINNAHVMAKTFCQEGPGNQIMLLDP
jgi:hypothetical protein